MQYLTFLRRRSTKKWRIFVRQASASFDPRATRPKEYQDSVPCLPPMSPAHSTNNV